MLGRVDMEEEPDFKRRLDLVGLHTSNRAHERCFLPKYYFMRTGTMTTGDRSIIDGLCGREGG